MLFVGQIFAFVFVLILFCWTNLFNILFFVGQITNFVQLFVGQMFVGQILFCYFVDDRTTMLRGPVARSHGPGSKRTREAPGPGSGLRIPGPLLARANISCQVFPGGRFARNDIVLTLTLGNLTLGHFQRKIRCEPIPPVADLKKWYCSDLGH